MRIESKSHQPIATPAGVQAHTEPARSEDAWDPRPFRTATARGTPWDPTLRNPYVVRPWDPTMPPRWAESPYSGDLPRVFLPAMAGLTVVSTCFILSPLAGLVSLVVVAAALTALVKRWSAADAKPDAGHMRASTNSTPQREENPRKC